MYRLRPNEALGIAIATGVGCFIWGAGFLVYYVIEFVI